MSCVLGICKQLHTLWERIGALQRENLHTRIHTYTHARERALTHIHTMSCMLGMCRQLHTLWERMEALRRENSVLDQRLEGEIQMQKKTQAELYASRAQVGVGGMQLTHG